MKLRGITIVLVVLAVAIMATACLAGELTGSRNYGLSVDAGVLEIRTGSTLNYEVLPDLFLTLDMQTRYSRVSRPLTRYELSANWYPDWLFLRGYCVSIGGALRTEKGPQWFVEVSTPWSLSIPKWLRFWEWWGKK